MTSITFLGTGGGRFATIYQIRSTGGIYLQDGVNIHIDPGPGALGSMKELSIDPARTDAILISHCHPDHYVDAEVLLEGMAMGGFKKKGFLIGSQTVLEGNENLGPCISQYHRSLPEKVMIVRKGDRFTVGNIDIGVTPTVHNDPLGVGFRFETSGGIISYVSDTEIHEAVVEAHRGARILILNLTRPLGSKVPRHLETEEAAEMVKGIKPEVAVLTHFGMKIIHDGVTSQSRFIEKESGVRTIAAEDFMKLGVGRSIRISSKGKKKNG
ncbi:MAG: MBL fold metallo-hydrolase [Methanomassiliicoccales archaeon]|nr:MBL fold metallo-hydrolase [Methanomassiliicoccales archaeon]NYT16072.1 MBL fold metallo-hydrolase [Methanomassiliicoccales archaeon]